MSFKSIPRYEELTVGTDGCLIKAGLRSVTDLGTGFTAVPAGTEAANIAYSTNGVKLPYDARLTFTVTGATTLASLQHNCIIGFTIDTAWLTDAYNDVTYDQYAIASINTSSALLNVKKGANAGAASAAYIVSRFGVPSTQNAKVRGIVGGRSRVVLYKTPRLFQLYVDDYLVAENRTANSNMPTSANMATLYVGGRNGTERSPKDHYISDYFLIHGQNISFPVLPKLRHINVYGDSKPSLGNYTQTGGTIYAAILVDTPDDYTVLNTSPETYSAQDVTNFESNSGMFDAGFLPSMHRELANRKLYVGDRLHSWAEGGAGVIVAAAGDARTLKDRIDSSVASYPNPTVAVIDVGTNDAGDTGTPIDAAWQTEFVACLTVLINAGCSQIVIVKQTGRTDLSGATKTANDAKIVQINAYYDTLPATYSQVKVVDPFTPTDGVNPPASWFQADGVHPSAALDILKGQLVAGAIV